MRWRFTSSSSANCIGVYFRHLDDFGDPVVVRPAGCLQQIGFEEEDALFPTIIGCFADPNCCGNISPFHANSLVSI